MKIPIGCIYTEKEPAQRFCECGKPLELYTVPYGHVALPIEWIPNGCGKHPKKKPDDRVGYDPYSVLPPTSWPTDRLKRKKKEIKDFFSNLKEKQPVK